MIAKINADHILQRIENERINIEKYIITHGKLSQAILFISLFCNDKNIVNSSSVYWHYYNCATLSNIIFPILLGWIAANGMLLILSLVVVRVYEGKIWIGLKNIWQLHSLSIRIWDTSGFAICQVLVNLQWCIMVWYTYIDICHIR